MKLSKTQKNLKLYNIITGLVSRANMNFLGGDTDINQ